MHSKQLNVQQRAGFQARPLLRRPVCRSRRTVQCAAAKDGYKVLVVGGGSAGITTAAHYARKMPGQVAVIEVSRLEGRTSLESFRSAPPGVSQATALTQRGSRGL